jgi:hypothetical protein
LKGKLILVLSFTTLNLKFFSRFFGNVTCITFTRVSLCTYMCIYAFPLQPFCTWMC